MSTTFKNQMRDVMTDAWRLFRVTGETFADCLKKAWMLLKLKIQMAIRTVQFFFMKVSGEVRQAFGTMRDNVIANKVKGDDTCKKNEHLFTYWDCEKQEFRSFKKFNLLRIA